MKPRLLDLFCCAGGAAMGYRQAGFEVVGVDIKPQPNYPFEFIQQGALEFLTDTLRYEARFFDAIHASPPCQAFTAYRRKGHGVGDGYPNLIGPVRDLLQATGLPYVIENVEGAPLEDPVLLCGSMFRRHIRRHRLFETNWPLVQPACDHAWHKAHGKIYPGATNRDGRYTCEIGVWRIQLETQKAAMGVAWDVTLGELSEMVPPAYTHWIGIELLAYLAAGMKQEAAA